MVERNTHHAQNVTPRGMQVRLLLRALRGMRCDLIPLYLTDIGVIQLAKITTRTDAERAIERIMNKIAVEKLTSKDAKKLKALRKELQDAKAVLAAINKNGQSADILDVRIQVYRWELDNVHARCYSSYCKAKAC